MEPSVDWIVAAIPQQMRNVPALDGLLRLDLRGPGGRQVHLGVRDGRFEASEGGAVVATVASSTADLLRWVTRRRGWRDLDVRVSGDETAAAPVLDAIRVF